MDKLLLNQYEQKMVAVILDHAIKDNENEVVKKIFELTDFEADYNDNHAFKLAVESENYEVFRMLMKQKQPVQEDLEKLLIEIIQKGNFDMVNYLYDFIEVIYNPKTLKLILKSNHDERLVLSFINKCEKTIFENEGIIEEAVRKQGLEVIQELEKKGCNLHDSDEHPLLIALRTENSDVADYIMQSANVQANNNNLLREMAQLGKEEAVVSILKRGANVHAAQESAVIRAAAFGNVQTLKILCEAGADIHARNDLALKLAVDYGKYENVKFLLGSFDYDRRTIKLVRKMAKHNCKVKPFYETDIFQVLREI